MNTHIVLASHGSMAEGTASAMRMIVGEQPEVYAYGLDTWETPDAIREQVEKLISAHPEDRYIILCDLKGGSVHNRLMDLCMQGDITVVCGMNLEIVLNLVLADDPGADEIRAVVEESKGNMECYDRHSFENMAEEEGGELW